MIEKTERIGNFTSSEIWKLMKSDKTGKAFGAPALTYIEEKRIERKLGRSIRLESYSRAMAWGKFMENRVFDLLPFGYVLCSDKPDIHPTIPEWAGTKDFQVPGKKIGDIKCYEPKNFALFADVLMEKNPHLFRNEFPEEYWQLVSNAIINGVNTVEAILYMPYLSELPEIREMVEMYDGEDQWKYAFIANSDYNQLSYLPDNGYYKNLNIFEFEVPAEDIEALTDRVKMAIELLIK